MGKVTEVITNENEIKKIIKQLNDSPRTFKPNEGFRYDHMHHGFLIFENEYKKVELAFVIPKGSTLTKYWEIETEFEFGKGLE